MNVLKGACIIGQSGGPTSVINASAYGVIATALKDPNITRVLGAEHGIKGVLNDRLFDMSQEDPAELERYFEKMHRLFVDMKEKNIDNVNMDFLSMGMSGDYEAAIRQGANIVRIGSALFGKRIYKEK